MLTAAREAGLLQVCGKGEADVTYHPTGLQWAWRGADGQEVPEPQKHLSHAAHPAVLLQTHGKSRCNILG